MPTPGASSVSSRTGVAFSSSRSTSTNLGPGTRDFAHRCASHLAGAAPRRSPSGVLPRLHEADTTREPSVRQPAPWTCAPSTGRPRSAPEVYRRCSATDPGRWATPASCPARPPSSRAPFAGRHACGRLQRRGPGPTAGYPGPSPSRASTCEASFPSNRRLDEMKKNSLVQPNYSQPSFMCTRTSYRFTIITQLRTGYRTAA